MQEGIQKCREKVITEEIQRGIKRDKEREKEEGTSERIKK